MLLLPSTIKTFLEFRGMVHKATTVDDLARVSANLPRQIILHDNCKHCGFITFADVHIYNSNAA